VIDLLLDDSIIKKMTENISCNWLASAACHRKIEDSLLMIMRHKLEQLIISQKKHVEVEVSRVYPQNARMRADLAVINDSTDQIELVLEAKQSYSFDVLMERWDQSNVKGRMVEDVDKLEKEIPSIIKDRSKLYFLLFIIHIHSQEVPPYFKYKEHNRVASEYNFASPQDFFDTTINKLRDSFNKNPIVTQIGSYDMIKPIPIYLFTILFAQEEFDLIRKY